MAGPRMFVKRMYSSLGMHGFRLTHQTASLKMNAEKSNMHSTQNIPSSGSLTQQALREHVGRLSYSVEQINARIARLAKTLHMSLDRDSDIAQALQLPVSNSGDALQRRLRQELRGLLVLRYGMAARFSQKMGASLTRELFAYAEENVQRAGFCDGDDGLHLKDLQSIEK